MSDRESLAPELKAVEAALSSLAPTSPTAADRDRLMFAAGRAATGPRRPWVWPVAAVATALVALVVGRQTAPQPANVPASPIAQPMTIEHRADVFVAATSPSSYLQLRRRFHRLDAVADVGAAAADPNSPHPTSHQALLHELLN